MLGGPERRLRPAHSLERRAHLGFGLAPGAVELGLRLSEERVALVRQAVAQTAVVEGDAEATEQL